MADLRIVDAPVLLQESITDDVKMPTGGLGNFSVRLGDILWYVITKEQLANKNYVDLSSKGVQDKLDTHIADKANPHQVTKAQVGLGNVDNTADVDKPVSNAVNSAIITATSDMATKTYVNSKDGDLTTLKTADKTNLVKAINEVVSVKADKATTLVGYGISDAYTKSEIDTTYNGIKTLYDKNVEAGVGANGWDANLVSYGEMTQKQINDGLGSIAQLLSIKNPRDGMRVAVKSYHTGQNKGGGTFVYDSTKASKNDGGVIINGWVRQIGTPPNPYHFGAYGDWNPTAQTGHDDSVAFQKCIDYILSNYTDFRGAKSGRQLTLDVGSYLVGGLQFKGSGWSFRMVGQGMYTQLWHKKELGRHVVNLEYTYFENIFFNGSAKTFAEPKDAVDYVFDFYLTNEAADIDTHFYNCGFSGFNVFARVDGRGFIVKNCQVNGGKDALLEIYCDPNIAYHPSLPAHTVVTSMRHYVIDGIRVDASPGLIKVTGTGSQKDYINGITIRNSEITGCYWLIDAPDATLVGLRLQNNFGIQCFPSYRVYGAVTCKGIVDAIDTDNNWNNYIGNNESAVDFTQAAMYRANTIDGLTISKLRVKDSAHSIVRFIDSGNNIKVLDSTFKNFSPAPKDSRIVWNESNISSNATNILISHNTVDAKRNTGAWMNNITGSSSFKAVNNIYPVGFSDQRIPYNPDFLVNGVITTDVVNDFNQSYYEIDGNHINVYIAKGVRSTQTIGNIAYSLPVPAIVESTSYSVRYSGNGKVDRLEGFTIGSYNFSVNASTEQRAIVQINGTNLDLSSKTGNLIQIIGTFRYRFK